MRRRKNGKQRGGLMGFIFIANLVIVAIVLHAMVFVKDIMTIVVILVISIVIQARVVMVGVLGIVSTERSYMSSARVWRREGRTLHVRTTRLRCRQERSQHDATGC